MFKVKDVFRTLASLALVFTLMATQALFFLNHVVLTPNTYYDYLNQPTYFSLVRKQIDTQLGNIATLNNIPVDTLTKTLSDEEIRAYGQQATEDYVAYFRGTNPEYDTKFDMTAIAASVSVYVQQYAAASGTDYQSVYADTVTKIVAEAEEAIEGTVMVLDPALVISTGVGPKVANVMKRVPSMEIVMLIVSLILIGVQWLLNNHHRMRTLWWCGSSLLVSSIMMLIPGLYLQITKVASGFGLQSESVKWITEKCISSLIMRWNVMEAMALLISIAVMVFYVLNRKKRKERERRRVSRPRTEAL